MVFLFRRSKAVPIWLTLFVLLCVLYLAIGDVWVTSLSGLTSGSEGKHDSESQAVYNSEYIVVEEEEEEEEEESESQVDCRNVPGADSVMVVLKTGASEIYEKLPIHLNTLFRCTPNHLIFSDLAHNVSTFEIHDVLASLDPSIKNHHEDFALYWALEKYHREGQDLSALKGSKGWNLDKWKFLPMMHETYRKSPASIDWFVFIEADTILSWLNLLQWLATLDPTGDVYAGSMNYIESSAFAHGGSGFVLSRAALEKLEGKRNAMGTAMYDEKWEELTRISCCGDEVLGHALREAEVSLMQAWPRIQGEVVSTLDWTSNHWCTPVITWHHASPAEIDSMWQFETDWVKKHGWSTPFLYRDVYENFVSRHISVNRTAWDNASRYLRYSEESANFGESSGYEKRSVKTFELCAEACRSRKECVQWMWRPGYCQLGSDIRLGSIDMSVRDKWTSGWLEDRIDIIRAELEPCKAGGSR